MDRITPKAISTKTSIGWKGSDFPVDVWPSPHFTRGRAADVNMIVIHYISLPPGVFGTAHVIDFFTGHLDFGLHPTYESIRDLRVSAHFFIERNGRVHQFVDTDDTAWHAGESAFQGRTGCNDFSVGIELEGDSEHPFTDDQYDVLAPLCGWIMERYPLVTIDRIVGHSDIAPGRKFDPGPYFDWNAFRERLIRTREDNPD